MASNPPSDLSNLSDLLPGADDQLRCQTMHELVRLRQKLTAAKVQMAYFNRASVSRPMGRPLGQPVESFAALLFARLSGHSRKRAAEILSADPSRASGAIWSVAAHAHSDGVRTTADFEKWLDGTDKPSNP